MKIAIDINQINRDGGGISYVMKGLLSGAAKQSHEFIFITRSEQDLDIPKNSQQLVIPVVSKWKGGGFVWYNKVASKLKRMNVDILISPTLSPASMFFPRTVQIINDLSPISNKQGYFGARERVKFSLLFWLARKYAWKILTISQATKDEVQERHPEYGFPIEVIVLGLNKWVSQKVDDSNRYRVKSKYKLPSKFILSASTLQPRKNYVRMVQAFAKVLEEYSDLSYVITGGKGWGYSEIFKEVEELGLKGKVLFEGYVDDKDMPAIFSSAAAFAYASLEEGFGLPIIEARAMDLPVVCSDIPVFTEMKLDDSVIFVDPLSVDEIAEGMKKAIGIGRNSVGQEFKEYYSWGNTWDQILLAVESE